MKNQEDLKHLAKSLRARLDDHQDEKLKPALLLMLLGVVSGLEKRGKGDGKPGREVSKFEKQ